MFSTQSVFDPNKSRDYVMGAGELNMDHNFGVDLGSSVGVDVLLRGR